MSAIRFSVVTYNWNTFFNHLFHEVVEQGSYEKNRQALIRATTAVENMLQDHPNVMFDLSWRDDTVSVEGDKKDVECVARVIGLVGAFEF